MRIGTNDGDQKHRAWVVRLERQGLTRAILLSMISGGHMRAGKTWGKLIDDARTGASVFLDTMAREDDYGILHGEQS